MKTLPLGPELRARLRELFELDCTSPSGLRWRVSTSNRAPADSPAGTLNKSDGYWYVQVDGKLYLAHRLIWALTHDEDPGNHQIDHIDGKRANNDPANLRLATHDGNCHNAKQRCDNTSGYKGVRRCSDYASWQGRVMVHGKEVSKTFSDSKYGGTEAALTAAAEWARATREELHGEFARHG